MEEVLQKENDRNTFRDIMEDIVNVLKKTIQTQNNNNFVNYVKRNFSQTLADLLKHNKSLLAFDLGEEDDEFTMTRQFSSNQNPDDQGSAQHQDTFGLNRRNLYENESEEESEDEEGSDERHFKRRLRRRSSSQSEDKKVSRSRSRSQEGESKRQRRRDKKNNRKNDDDYDPLNPQQTSSFKQQQLQSQQNKQGLTSQMLQQLTPQQQQQIIEAQRNAWALQMRNNPQLLQQYQAQLMAMQQQYNMNNQNQGVPPIQTNPLMAQFYNLTQSLQPVPVQANSQLNLQQTNSSGNSKEQNAKQGTTNVSQQGTQLQKKSSTSATNLPPSKLEARKYSILVKNIPEDLNNIGQLNQYFSKFGYIQNINVDLTKKSALIKFKQIESAAKAGASTEPVFDNPKIKILYTIIEPTQSEDHLPLSPEKKGEDIQQHSLSHKQVPLTPGSKTYESEEMAKKRKLLELKREMEQQRKALMEKYNNDIKLHMRELNQDDLSEVQKKEIEGKIEECKVKLNALIKEEQAQKFKEKEEKKQQMIQIQKKKEESFQKPVELILYDIGPKQTFDQLIKTLRMIQKHGRVSDFKFTDEKKTQALVKFTNQTATYLLEALTSEGSTVQDQDLQFKVKLKEEQKQLPEDQQKQN